MSNFTFRPGTSTPQPVSEYPSWAAKEMIAFADWCLRQLQGDSGMGDGHWDQFPEYRRGRDYLSLLTRTTNPGLDQQDVPDRTPQPVSECPHNTPNLEDGYLKCNDCGVNLTNLLPPVKPVSDAAGAKELVAYTCGCVGVRSQPNCAIHSFCGQGKPPATTPPAPDRRDAKGEGFACPQCGYKTHYRITNEIISCSRPGCHWMGLPKSCGLAPPASAAPEQGAKVDWAEVDQWAESITANIRTPNPAPSPADRDTAMTRLIESGEDVLTALLSGCNTGRPSTSVVDDFADALANARKGGV